MQKKGLVLSISLTITLISLTCFTNIVFVSNNVLAQSPALSAPANETYHFVKEWGSEGSGDGQFKDIHGIAVDSKDNVYVADNGNNRIQVFDSDGNFITKWGSEGSGDGQFNYPEGIAVDSSDNVYVADRTISNMQYNKGIIKKFDSDGNFMTKWDYKAPIEGVFGDTIDIATGSNNVYISDSHFGNIQKFDSDGNFIAKWGSEGSGDGQFNYPKDIATGSSGKVYVTDSRKPFDNVYDSSLGISRIQLFAPYNPILPFNDKFNVDGVNVTATIQDNSTANKTITSSSTIDENISNNNYAIATSNLSNNTNEGIDNKTSTTIQGNINSGSSQESVPQSPAGITDMV